MVGVAAFAYALIHLTLYTADQKFDLAKVASEIVLRIYLTIGFTALLGLCGARRDLDRRDGPPARPALAEAAPAGLCDRAARG